MKKYALLVPAAALVIWSVAPTTLAVDRSGLSAPKRLQGVELARQAAGAAEAPVLIAAQRGQTKAVVRLIEQLGGRATTVLPQADFVAARLPAGALMQLERHHLVRALGVDRPVKLDPAAMQPLPETRSTEVPSASDPALSLKITRSEIRAPQLAGQTGADGTGTVIAVLDTGVDPLHPALTSTSGGQPKIIDWQDFTGEGDVATAETRTGAIGAIPSKSGVYRTGQFKEAQIPTGEMKSDVNRNGTGDDLFPVLVTDSREKGVYDTVYVDTNLNGDFADEKPLGAYRQTRQAATFPAPEGQDGVSFVVTRINPDGSGINLGYDGGSHGTHVAGIAAGHGPLQGVAPGAQVMAIKVLTSGGSGSWEGILQGMLYAASQGAHVVNMSLGGLAELNDGNDPQSLLIKDLSDKYGALFSIAAGNSGPGLNTMGLPGVAGAAITSGAYISSNTWKADYGLDVPQDGLWYFSSAGPRDDGGLKPDIVAPGTANAPIPTWAGRYAVFQGTSMAAPQTSGAAALLLGQAHKEGLKVKPGHVITALQTGARRLPGYGWYEQGYGLIQVDSAWQKLRQVAAESAPDLAGFGKAKAGVSATGLYAREFAAGASDARWALGNREFTSAKLALSYLPGNGLTVSGPAQVTLPGLQKRQIPLQFHYSNNPGVYDALMEARAPGQTTAAAQYLATVVVPHTFDQARGNRISGITGNLAPARYGRHFVQVPAGTAELTVTLTVPGKQGRVRLMAYTPDGMPYGNGTAWAGAPDSPEQQTLRIANPQPGVWEIDAYASHGGMNFGLAENKYSLEMAARGVYATPARVNLAPKFGLAQNVTLAFANYYGDVEAVATGAGFAQPVAERMTVENLNYGLKFFEVKPGTALLRAGYSDLTDVNAELELGLYYNDPNLGGWAPVGRLSGDRFARTVELAAPAPGQYAVQITGNRVPAGKTDLTFRLTQVQGGAGIQVSAKPVTPGFGQTFTLPVTATLPAARGGYLGAVTLTDKKTGQVLTVVPLELK